MMIANALSTHSVLDANSSLSKPSMSILTRSKEAFGPFSCRISLIVTTDVSPAGATAGRL